MKVVQINSTSGGSTGSIACAIRDYSKRMGAENHLVFGFGVKKASGDVRLSNGIKTRLHDQLSKISGLQGYYSFFDTVRLIRYLKRIEPDVVHLHNLHGNYLCIPLLFRYLGNCKTRVIITLHDCWLFTGKCPHFTDVSCVNWMKGCGHCPQLSIYPKSYCFDRTQKCLMDKRYWIDSLTDPLIITVSDWLKECVKISQLKNCRIERIYNGVNTTCFHPDKQGGERVKANLGIEDKYVILGVASGWPPPKGLSEFCRLAGLLKEDEIIVLVGLKKSQIENLPRNIIGIERTESKAELAAFYSMADVLFNASTEETFGLVVAESAACGTPSVVYHSTACDEIVIEGTGVSVDPHDIDAVYSAVERIRNNGSLTYSGKCIEHIKSYYSDEVMARSY